MHSTGPITYYGAPRSHLLAYCAADAWFSCQVVFGVRLSGERNRT